MNKITFKLCDARVSVVVAVMVVSPNLSAEWTLPITSRRIFSILRGLQDSYTFEPLLALRRGAYRVFLDAIPTFAPLRPQFLISVNTRQHFGKY